MKLFIPKDYFNNPKPPRAFLCTPGKKRMGELPASNMNLNAKWAQYSELSFDLPMTYVDVLTGETKVHPLYEKVAVPRNVLVEDLSYFAIQDIDDATGENDVKNVSCFSIEYAVANKYLNSFYINTGEVDSVEVLYNESIHGINYHTDSDSFYKLATGDFDPYESYYVKTPTEKSYIWEQVQIADEEEYIKYITSTSDNEYEKLYMKNFPNVQFYNKNRPELSLLHLVLKNVPEWKIGNVDQALWRRERKFSEDRVSVYDFLNTTVAETVGCVFVWDSLTGQVHAYEEVDDDDVQNEASTRWTTDVYVSKSNLASQLNVRHSGDNIKTKLVVTGSDNLDIREVNLGSNAIMDLSYYHSTEWMEQDLFDAYARYLVALQEANSGLDADGRPSTKFPISYSDAMNGWVSANNQYNEIMHAIPADGNVVLIGDEFKKLYCIYTPINTAYANVTISYATKWVDTLYSDEAKKVEITNSNDLDSYVVQGYNLVYRAGDGRFQVMSNLVLNSRTALIKQLNSYHVDDDTEAKKNDNILLKLKNANSDVATVRIYDKRAVASSYDPDVKYYTKDSKGVYAVIKITDAVDFSEQKKTYGDNLYTNDYYVQSIVVRASHGTPEAADEYSLLEWIEDTLTATKMDLKEYNVTYIGTMGAYFVLAKNEKLPENLQDYGVNLLQEKHDTYTTIFRTQTEAMLSQEKYQCIVQDEEPEGDYKDGTRWLDTNSNPAVLKAYDVKSESWNVISAYVSVDDQKNYENYQRYIDNYEKMIAVQSVLVVKEREAEYCRDGYAVSDRRIVVPPTDGSSLEGKMQRAAEAHFAELTKNTGVSYTITRVGMNTIFPLYTFTTSFDPNNTFAVYLSGTTPYVSYANSQGVYQMVMNYIREHTQMDNNYFTDEQLAELSPFIREDEFNDSNFLLTGYESEEERLSICKELMEAAAKELKTLCQPSLEFSMDMANILAIAEFAPLFNQFQLGNFIRVEIRDGNVKRARLLEVNLNFDDLGDFSCTFGNLKVAKSEVDRHADLLSQAITAGKQVAKSSGTWQKTVDKTNALEENISNGLRDAALAIGSASGQAISWDSTGMHFRKYRDGSTTEYEPEEMAIINNSLVATNDSWVTSKAAFGKYYINGEERWGPIAEYVTADQIEGKFIKGGKIQIGDETNENGSLFIVNEDGSVEIRSGGTNYINAMKEIDDAYRYRVVLTYNNSTIFSDINDDCTITCSVYDYNISDDANITQKLIDNGAKFSWIRTSASGSGDIEWNNNHRYQTSNKLTITTEDISKNATFACNIEVDEEMLQEENKT